jgi:hypothetical protein
MIELKNTSICYPPNETWFICWDNTRAEIKAFGSILTDQCLETPWVEIDYYNNEEQWIEILVKNGINPFE